MGFKPLAIGKKDNDEAALAKLYADMKKAGHPVSVKDKTVFSKDLEKALKAFQKKVSIKDTGKYDAETDKKLQEALKGATGWPYGKVAVNMKTNQKIRAENRKAEVEILSKAKETGASATELVQKLKANYQEAEDKYQEWLAIAKPLAELEKKYLDTYKLNPTAANETIQEGKVLDDQYTKSRKAWQAVIDAGRPLTQKVYQNLILVKNLKWEYEDPEFKLKDFERKRKNEKKELVDRLKILKFKKGDHFAEIAKNLAEIDEDIQNEFKKTVQPLKDMVELQKKFDAAVKESDFDTACSARDDATDKKITIGRAEKQWAKLEKARDEVHGTMDAMTNA